jgi:hypothetical protein
LCQDSLSAEITPQVKDISLLFDEMNDTVFPTVKEAFLMLDPLQLLQTFLQILKNHDNSKNLLFNNKEQDQFFPGNSFSLFNILRGVAKESFLKFYLPKDTMEILFWKFLKIKKRLSNFPTTTHLDLFKEAEPYLAR